MIAPLYVSDDVFAGRHRKVAAFDDEASVTYLFDRHLRLRVQDLRPSPAASLDAIVEWLANAYGQPVLVDQVEQEAQAIWEDLRTRGLVRGWSERVFDGTTVPGPTVQVQAGWARPVSADDAEPG